MKLRGIMIMALCFLFVFAVAHPTASEPNNPVALFVMANSAFIRGATCGTWPWMPPDARRVYLLGVISMQDTLQVAWRQSGAPYIGGLAALMGMLAYNLPGSAEYYSDLVDVACASMPPTTPVLAVIYWVK
jgi:hypothetical protein